MLEQKKKVDFKKVDTKEFELPETIFIRDIENKVFQGIVLQCLSLVEGISLVEGNFIDSILGRGGPEGVKGIVAEQDSKNHSVNIKIEVNICYGTPIPEKAEEIQTKVAEEITKLTGLHVSCIHIVFKNVIPYDQIKKMMGPLATSGPPIVEKDNVEEEYNDEF
jgi:uncharacterized alkaline shock family protein YloU